MLPGVLPYSAFSFPSVLPLGSGFSRNPDLMIPYLLVVEYCVVVFVWCLAPPATAVGEGGVVAEEDRSGAW